MKINYSKTKCVLFNPSRKHDFMPQILTPIGEPLEVIEGFRLLGIDFWSDLGWINNTNYICQKGYSRLWILRNLRLIGADQDELVDVYTKQCRVMVELTVLVWEPGLTKSESRQIKRFQKVACVVILGDKYKNYKKIFEDSIPKIIKSETKRNCWNICQKIIE